MKKNKSAKVEPKLITAAVIFLFFVFFIAYGVKTLMSCDYFRVKDIITREGKTDQISYLKGRNIFSVDLKYEAGRISEFYPDCSKIILVRLLPDRIFADFIKRKAVALVRLYRYFAVDEEGVIFPADTPAQESSLPFISGIEAKIPAPRPGKRYNIRELYAALSIIKRAKLNPVLRDFRISKIDASNVESISVFIPLSSVSGKAAGFEVLEVKLGADGVRNKIDALAGLIVAGKKDLANIKYIDLRFTEPVIKLRDDK